MAGVTGHVTTGQMSVNSTGFEALVTGLYKNPTFLKPAKGPNYHTVWCMSHITEQSSS